MKYEAKVTHKNSSDMSKSILDASEFNANVLVYWDYANDPSNIAKLNIKRDRTTPGKHLFNVEINNVLKLKSIKLNYSSEKIDQESKLNASLVYETQSGNKNDISFKSFSASNSNDKILKVEVDVSRPKFNAIYEHKLNKADDKLKDLQVIVKNFLKLIIAANDDERKIYIEFYNKDKTQYKINASIKYKDDFRIIEGVIKANDETLSHLNGTFIPKTNNFDGKLTNYRTNSSFNINLALSNESYASAYLKNNDKELAALLIQISSIKSSNLKELLIEVKWNKFLTDIQSQIFGTNKNKTNFDLNLSSVTQDVRNQVDDVLKPMGISSDKYIPRIEKFLQYFNASYDANLPFPLNFISVYNSLVKKLDNSVEALAEIPLLSHLSEFVVTLPQVSYDKSEDSKYEKRLVIRQKIGKTSHLSYINELVRNYVKSIPVPTYNFKFTRPTNNFLNSISHFNNYKGLATENAFVGSVFNRRNVIGFDGESVILHSKCRYLLAHDMSMNKFSVILNYNDDKYPLTLHLHGKAPLHLSADSLKQDAKAISLPKYIKTDSGMIYASRISNGICVSIDYELKACCYEDTGSCSVAFTRFYTGRINGLFGKSDLSHEKIEQVDWAIDKCGIVPRTLAPVKKEADERCSKLFSDATPNFSLSYLNKRGWNSLCRIVISAVPENFCRLSKAFGEAARLQNLIVSLPKECYKCKNSLIDEWYSVGQTVSSEYGQLSITNKGADFVFITLECNSTESEFKYSDLVNYYQSSRNSEVKELNNNIYAVNIIGSRVSLSQDGNKRFKIPDISFLKQPVDDTLRDAIFYAQSIFARRLASARHLIILSCGNCPSYNSATIGRLAAELESQNVIVSSWGLYQMKLVKNDENVGRIVGYDNEKFYHLKNNEVNSVEKSTLQVEFNTDACQVLADKTGGSVFNKNELKNKIIVETAAKSLKIAEELYSVTIKSCQFYNTIKGSYTDFKFDRIRLPKGANSTKNSQDN